MKKNTTKAFTLGCDPGQSGAIALLNKNVLVGIWDMPAVPKTTGKGNEISAQLLVEIFTEIMTYVRSDHNTEVQAIIEVVRAMPGQGVTSSFSFGRSLGVIEGGIAAHRIPINYVRPQVWKKHFGLLKKEKDASRGLVLAKYPDKAHLFKRKKDVDRSDAVLIALYGVYMRCLEN